MSDYKRQVMAVHASYTHSNKNNRDDAVMVKEVWLDPTGERKSALRIFRNPKRPFYVTKPKHRNHKEKKEYENVGKCDKFVCTQRQLPQMVAKKLKCAPSSLRRMGVSPYLYWTDAHVTSIVMNKYREKFPDAQYMPIVGMMDFEWDVDDQRPTIGSYCYEDTVYLTVREDVIRANMLTNKQFIQRVEDQFESQVKPLLDEFYNGKVGKKQQRRDFKIQVEVVRLDIDVIRRLFAYTHETKPDYLSFWNGISDLTVIQKIADGYGIELSTFMCDPEIPEEFRNTKVIEGMRGSKKDARGNNKRIDIQDEHHTIDNFASWQFIDLMGGYAFNRAHLPNLPSYAMDFVLPRELGLGKLKLCPQVPTADPKVWHKTMSTQHIVEYTLYAAFDNIGPKLLEDKNFEISSQAYSNLDINPIADFRKNPRKLTTAAHFSFIKKGLVVAATSQNMEHEIDQAIYASDGWIVTLNTHYHDTVKTAVLADSDMEVLFFEDGSDSDLTSSYPTNQEAANISKGTNVTEMVSIDVADPWVGKYMGLNLSAGPQNSIAICYEVLDLPHLHEVVDLYTKENGVKEDDVKELQRPAVTSDWDWD